MPRLITIIWMTILWLIAVVAGATFYYGVNTGLGTLAVVALILAILAFVASLLPLSAGFLSELGITPRPAARQPQSGSSRPPPHGVVHEAGSPQGDRQTCARCGVTLCDFTDPATSRTGWAAGTRLAESHGRFTTVDGNVAEEALCSPIRTGLWSVSS